MRRLCFLLPVVFAFPLAAAEQPQSEEIPKALHEYVERPEPEFAWAIRERTQLDAGTVYDVELTSQVWQGITWKHVLHLYEPAQLTHREHVLLFVTGGRIGRKPSDSDVARGLELARLAQARIAMLYQVPNQPLLGDRFEDDLITETWLRFLDTGDANWPLLFPMVKSAVKAMDAIEQIAESEWDAEVTGFVVTGASKRGWTSWLSAVADKRVVAIAPMVIDVLNFHPQMHYQLETWGDYSEQINDYTSKGLVKLEKETPRDIQLRTWMDPYTYRRELTVPKLLINGTNDRYWVVDALNIYWDDLEGPKYILYVPNAGHNLDPGREHALSTLAAFFHHSVSDRPLPQLRWKHEDTENGELRLAVESSSNPVAAQLWIARSPNKDFRNATWESHPLDGADGDYLGIVEKPANGYIAIYGELRFELELLPYSLCTQIRRE